MSLTASNLSFSYRSKKVLDNLNFTLKKSELTCLLGKNGAGKSTLLKCLLGFLPYSGTVEVEGKELKELSYKEKAQKIAYIPQATNSELNFSVIDMVLMGTESHLKNFECPGEKERVVSLEALKILGMEKFSDRYFNTLSGGEKQLVLIARALAQRSKIILMDEPCSSLDYGNQIKVMEKVKNLAKNGYSILMSTHSPDHAFIFADSVITLEKHSITPPGSPSSVLTEEKLSSLYDISVRIIELPDGTKICRPSTGQSK